MRRKCEKNRKNRGSKMGKIQRNTPFEAFKNVIFLVRFSPEFSQIRSNLTPPILAPPKWCVQGKKQGNFGSFLLSPKIPKFLAEMVRSFGFWWFFWKIGKKIGEKKNLVLHRYTMTYRKNCNFRVFRKHANGYPNCDLNIPPKNALPLPPLVCHRGY